MKSLFDGRTGKPFFHSRREASSTAAALPTIRQTAARAAVTAAVSFAVGWALKKMFEKSVAEAIPNAAPKPMPSQGAQGAPAKYKSPGRRLPEKG